jgi:hypothetical protein
MNFQPNYPEILESLEKGIMTNRTNLLGKQEINRTHFQRNIGLNKKKSLQKIEVKLPNCPSKQNSIEPSEITQGCSPLAISVSYKLISNLTRTKWKFREQLSPYFKKRWKISPNIYYFNQEMKMVKESYSQLVYNLSLLNMQHHKFNNAKSNLKSIQFLMFNLHNKSMYKFLKKFVFKKICQYISMKKLFKDDSIENTINPECLHSAPNNSNSSYQFFKFSGSNEYYSWYIKKHYPKYERYLMYISNFPAQMNLDKAN